MVSIHRVSKAFGEQSVLRDFSLEVASGSIVAIVGPSGVGKSTLLKLVAGVLAPDSGRVEIEATRMGYVFQEPRLLPWRTARENIALVLRSAGRGKHEARLEAGEWLARMRLQGFEDHYPSQLSGGMMQRVALGRAFAAAPDIVLMDEPFSSLDAALKAELLLLIGSLVKERGTTVLYVTHDLSEALQLADRVVEMVPDGIIKELGLEDREELLHRWITALLSGREWV